MTKLNKEQLLTLVGGNINRTYTVKLMPEFGVKDKFGGRHIVGDSNSFLSTLRKLGGVIPDSLSYVDGEWVLGEEAQIPLEAPVETVVQPNDSDAQLDVVIETTSSTAAEEASNVFADIDWEYVAGISTSTVGKKELKAYAEKFGVALKANMSYENMMIAFKEAAGYTE